MAKLPRFFQSKYDNPNNRCTRFSDEGGPGCGGRIHQGDSIGKYQGHYMHEECIRALHNGESVPEAKDFQAFLERKAARQVANGKKAKKREAETRQRFNNVERDDDGNVILPEPYNSVTLTKEQQDFILKLLVIFR